MNRNACGHPFDREKFAAATCETFLALRNDEQISANFSNHDKIAQLRRYFFADVDALERTGAVQRALALAVSGYKAGEVSTGPSLTS